MRQTCCDLRLLGLSPNETTEPSAKLDLLDELLEEAIDGEHRVLVFSQFVKMLDLVRERLAASEIAHCYLAGLTKNRQQEVDRFQNDETIPVFLISLKAGGVGLNLSAADTVIHFDPWWNPAVEAQATDRAHRIGQTRVVTAYKLITRDTVEEKILNLQKRKRELASAMLENEEPLMTGLTTADLTELPAYDVSEEGEPIGLRLSGALVLATRELARVVNFFFDVAPPKQAPTTAGRPPDLPNLLRLLTLSRRRHTFSDPCRSPDLAA